jgi:hypothetical protein
VNEAVRLGLGEDAEDLATFDQRKGEPDLPFEEAVRELQRSGETGT